MTDIKAIRERLKNAEMDSQLGALEAVLDAAHNVVRNWENGDLAASVCELHEALKEIGLDPYDPEFEEGCWWKVDYSVRSLDTREVIASGSVKLCGKEPEVRKNAQEWVAVFVPEASLDDMLIEIGGIHEVEGGRAQPVR